MFAKLFQDFMIFSSLYANRVKEIDAPHHKKNQNKFHLVIKIQLLKTPFLEIKS